MKLKVGDKVRIRKDLNVDSDYGELSTASEMIQYAGKLTTITRVYKNCYKLKIDDREWSWTPKMFTPFTSWKDRYT